MLNSSGGTLSAESSTTDLLACGLYEDELEELEELLVAHSPKVGTSRQPPGRAWTALSLWFWAGSRAVFRARCGMQRFTRPCSCAPLTRPALAPTPVQNLTGLKAQQ